MGQDGNDTTEERETEAVLERYPPVIQEKGTNIQNKPAKIRNYQEELDDQPTLQFKVCTKLVQKRKQKTRTAMLK
jgi:hypothetical protein